MDGRIFDDLKARVSAVLPPSLGQVREDLAAQISTLVSGALSKMDLVTREEFDLQVALLERCEERIYRLEQQLAASNNEDDALESGPGQ